MPGSALLPTAQAALVAFDRFIEEPTAQWSEPHPLREAMWAALERLRVECGRAETQDRG